MVIVMMMVILMMNKQVGKNLLKKSFTNCTFFVEFQTHISLSVAQINTNQFDEIDLDDDAIEDCQKEMQRLL